MTQSVPDMSAAFNTAFVSSLTTNMYSMSLASESRICRVRRRLHEIFFEDTG